MEQRPKATAGNPAFTESDDAKRQAERRTSKSGGVYAEVPRSIRFHTLLGLALIAISFGGFGYWAFAAPLAAAIIAQGSFVANGNNKIVQHLEGGIIEELLVAEGDKVKAGDILVKLDQTVARANARMLNLKRLRLEAVVGRLRAEAVGEDAFSVPQIVARQADDPDVRAIMESQNVNFQSKKIKLRDQLNLIDQNIRSLEFRARGYALQQASFNRQLEILNEEREAKSKLADKGLIRRPELMAWTARSPTRSARSAGSNPRSRRATRRSTATARRRSSPSIPTSRRRSTASKRPRPISTAYASRFGRRPKCSAAPPSVRLSTAPSYELLPYGRRRHRKRKADHGDPAGQCAADHRGAVAAYRHRSAQGRRGRDDRLSALNRRTTPVLKGKVFYVSADSIEEEVAGGQQRDVYIVRVEVPASEIGRIHGFHPVPGMPAEVLITTSERTFFEYLTKPITDSMSRAFKET